MLSALFAITWFFSELTSISYSPALSSKSGYKLLKLNAFILPSRSVDVIETQFAGRPASKGYCGALKSVALFGPERC